MPLTAAVLADIEIAATKGNPDPEGRVSSRVSYAYQLILGRKFTEGFSLQLMPTLVHRNLVQANEKNDVYAIGVGARQKITKRFAITAEAYYTPSSLLPNGKYTSLSLGFDLETGGHVFQLHFTNSTSMAHKGFIAETTGNWLDGGIHFGFNVSRVFTVFKPKIK